VKSVQRLAHDKVQLNVAQRYVNLLNLNIVIHNLTDKNDAIHFFFQRVSFVSRLRTGEFTVTFIVI